jgi:hypothetical protein
MVTGNDTGLKIRFSIFGFQVSAQPPVKKTAGLIEQETL